uniref:Integrase catalytic domain-containing protein n=1 Tax=Fagus sylvatica TaxID=28930 RepID=A0A2N9IWZ4_FAGSY
MRLLTTPLALVCFESNLVDVPLNSWWVDTGASIHVTNSLHGFKSKRRPYDGEVAVYMGNGEKALVEFIGVVNLPLASGGVLVLDDVVYVPSLRRSLISVSKLDSSGFGFHFGNKRFVLYSGSREIASGALCDGLYKRLGHISRERMERLTRNGILDSLDFSDFQTCVDCVKGKLTRARKKGATRRQIPGPFAKFLQECGVDAQYTMLGEPEQNGVAERRNRTLMDMKLDPRSVSGYFVGYANKSKGYRFYCPSYSMRIVESKRAVFLEGDSVNEVVQPCRFAFKEERVTIPVPPSLESAVSLPLTEHVDEAIPMVIEAQPIDDALLRRSQRSRKPAISDDYMVYLQEHEFDIGVVDDPSSYSQAIQSSQSTKWIDAMVDELKSMDNNNVWDLVDLPNGCRPIGCKWVFKTKKDSTGKIERYKARLVAKGFSQKEGIDYKETFSPVSSKDSFRIPDGFQVSGKEHMVCKLKKSIYGLKQASRQWYLKFDNVVTSFGFKENPVDHCIYLKINGSKIIFLVLYVDDILLASNDLGLLRETKRFLFDNFEMKDLGEASFVLGIEIHRDRSRGILGLSQKSYISRVLERFNMSTCSAGDAPIVKGDKLSKLQCPQNDLKRNEMKKIPYASAVGSLMYAQVCTRPDIAFAISVLGRRSNLLEVVGYADADYAGCADDLKSTSGYVFMLAGGVISWKSVKQTLTASSTMQAEYVACYEATLQAVWLRNFISRLEIVDSISKPLTIYNDNSAVVCFSKNNKRSSGSKHMHIKYLVVREKILEL